MIMNSLIPDWVPYEIIFWSRGVFRGWAKEVLAVPPPSQIFVGNFFSALLAPEKGYKEGKRGKNLR